MIRLPSSARNRGKRRLFYLDNLRTFLTMLVISHHIADTYSNTGGWYYMEAQPQDSISTLLIVMFQAINQSFFMGLFFMVSAYFAPLSFEKKGAAPFLKDRLLRLGVPLLIYFFALHPSLEYIVQRFTDATQTGYFNFMVTNITRKPGTGPLWFIMTLLIFEAAYIVIRVVTPKSEGEKRARPLPTDIQIAGFILCIGLLTFLVRIWFPVSRRIFDLPLAYFPLYISMYTLGVWANRFSWFDDLRHSQANRWFGVSLVVIALIPVIVALGGVLTNGTEAFEGGIYWQAYVYAALEPVLCVGISLKLLTMFMERFDTENRLSQRMARSSYAAYITHPYFVVCATLLLAGVALDPIIKFLVLCPLAVSSCFLVSDVVRRAPLLRRVL